MLDAEWRTSTELKTLVWGPPAEEPETFFNAKFYKNANDELHVRPGWNYSRWTLARIADWRKADLLAV